MKLNLEGVQLMIRRSSHPVWDGEKEEDVWPLEIVITGVECVDENTDAGGTVVVRSGWRG